MYQVIFEFSVDQQKNGEIYKVWTCKINVLFSDEPNEKAKMNIMMICENISLSHANQ